MSEQPTALALSLTDRAVLLVGGPVAGLVAGVTLPYVADWASDQEWVPFQGPLEQVASWDGYLFGTILIILGLLAGLALALYAIHESLTLKVDDARVILRRSGTEAVVDREQLSAVFLDRKELVLLGTDTREQAREATDVKKKLVAQAFRGHRYPWFDDDPHCPEYRLWVPATTDLSSPVNAVLTARSQALENEHVKNARTLRSELNKIGVVVQDRDNSQYWRNTAPGARGEPSEDPEPQN